MELHLEVNYEKCKQFHSFLQEGEDCAWQGLSRDASLGVQSWQAMAENIFNNLVLSSLCFLANLLQSLLLPGQTCFTVHQGGSRFAVVGYWDSGDGREGATWGSTMGNTSLLLQLVISCRIFLKLNIPTMQDFSNVVWNPFILGKEKFCGRFLTCISGLSISELLSPPFSLCSRFTAPL